MFDRISLINSLSSAYGIANSLTSHDEFLEHAKFLPPIGAEVEIPWSALIPQLRDILAGEKYSDLSPQKKTTFDSLCDNFERQNRHKYTRSLDFGIARGKDGFHEFAFAHAYWHRTASEEIRVLYGAELIPQNIPLPLHLTIGGFSRDNDAGIALCALELIGHTSQERLNQGYSPTVYKASWNRKGVCGIHEKWRAHLADGYLNGVELRTLFASSADQTASVIKSTQMLFYGIGQTRMNKESDAAQEWLALKSLVVGSVLKPFGLNKWWEGPHDGNNMQWSLFNEILVDPKFDAVRDEIKLKVDALENIACSSVVAR